MRKLLIVALAMGFANLANAQTKPACEATCASTGAYQTKNKSHWSTEHYQKLGKLDTAPRKKGLAIDSVKFRSPSKGELERLEQSKRFYLLDLKVADFNMANPPANSSEQTLAELTFLKDLQNKRTEADVETSKYLAGIYYNPKIKPGDENYRAFRDNLLHVGKSIGPWFQQDSLPLTTELLAKVMTDAHYYMWKLKFHYLRPRPYAIDLEIKNLEDANWSPYPSGHSITGHVLAEVLSLLAPEHQSTFFLDAHELAFSREILGVHYPSDTEASRIFAKRFVELLKQNKDFNQDLEKARSEWVKSDRRTVKGS